MAACWQLGAGHLDVLNPGAAASRDLTELSLLSWLELFEALYRKTIQRNLLIQHWGSFQLYFLRKMPTDNTLSSSHHIIILIKTWKRTFTNNSIDCKCPRLDCKSKSSHLFVRFQRNRIPKWLQIIPDWDQHWPWVQYEFGSTNRFNCTVLIDFPLQWKR